MIQLGTISIISIRKQINEATLKMLNKYSEVLRTNNEKSILDFINEQTQLSKYDGNRMTLKGDNFEVSSCIKFTLPDKCLQFNESFRVRTSR